MKKILIISCLLFTLIGCTQNINTPPIENNDDIIEENENTQEEALLFDMIKKIDIDFDDYHHLLSYTECDKVYNVSTCEGKNTGLIGINNATNNFYSTSYENEFVFSKTNNALYQYNRELVQQQVPALYGNILDVYKNTIIVHDWDYDGIDFIEKDEYTILHIQKKVFDHLIIDNFLYLHSVTTIYKINLDTKEIITYQIDEESQGFGPLGEEFKIFNANNKLFIKYLDNIYVLENEQMSKLNISLDGLISNLVTDNNYLYAIYNNQTFKSIYILDFNFNLIESIPLPEIEKDASLETGSYSYNLNFDNNNIKMLGKFYQYNSDDPFTPNIFVGNYEYNIKTKSITTHSSFTNLENVYHIDKVFY